MGGNFIIQLFADSLKWVGRQIYPMYRLLVFFLAAFLCAQSACQSIPKQTETQSLCTESWYQSVEQAIPSGDGMGHGPDIGSEEWKSVIEFKLGIRGNADVPDRDSKEWCNYINGFISR